MSFTDVTGIKVGIVPAAVGLVFLLGQAVTMFGWANDQEKKIENSILEATHAKQERAEVKKAIEKQEDAITDQTKELTALKVQIVELVTELRVRREQQ